MMINDIFLTVTLEKQTQQKLNQTLGNEIKQSAPSQPTQAHP